MNVLDLVDVLGLRKPEKVRHERTAYRAQRNGQGRFTRKLRRAGYRKMRRVMSRASRAANR